MGGEPDAYQTYVLRLPTPLRYGTAWRAKCQRKWQWHASIESLHTGKRHAFTSLEQLFAYWSEHAPPGVRHRYS